MRVLVGPQHGALKSIHCHVFLDVLRLQTTVYGSQNVIAEETSISSDLRRAVGNAIAPCVFANCCIAIVQAMRPAPPPMALHDLSF